MCRIHGGECPYLVESLQKENCPIAAEFGGFDEEESV